MLETLTINDYRPPPARQLLEKEQLKQVRARSNIRGVWLVFHAWAVIFLAMLTFALFPNPLTFILAVTLIGSRQLGLAVLMHDAAHGVLTRSTKLNFRLGQWFCAWPLLTDTLAYRNYHLKHHANTQQENDPDLILSAPFPITRKSLWRKIGRDLSGRTGWKQRKAQLTHAFGPPNQHWTQKITHFWHAFKYYLAAQAVLFSILAALGYGHFYFLFWLLPLLTWQQFVTRVRNIAEHAIVSDNNDPFRNARTTQANWLERIFLAPYWVNYHVEHHLCMWAPCYRLPKLQHYLKANGFGDRMEQAKSYWEVLRLASSKPNDQDQPGELIHHGRRRAA